MATVWKKQKISKHFNTLECGRNVNFYARYLLLTIIIISGGGICMWHKSDWSNW